MALWWRAKSARSVKCRATLADWEAVIETTAANRSRLLRKFGRPDYPDHMKKEAARQAALNEELYSREAAIDAAALVLREWERMSDPLRGHRRRRATVFIDA